MKKQNKKQGIACIILAAGKGTRFKSDIPKVLHPLCGRPMLNYVLDLTETLKIKNTITVLGFKYQQVKKVVPQQAKIVIQRRLLGTADAVKEGLAKLGNFRGNVLILYGDIPLLKKETIEKILKYHRENNLDATLLTAKMKNPKGYGRILRDEYSALSGIIEENDADDFQKSIKEVNTGIICFKKEVLNKILKYIKVNKRKKEYYLTDAIRLLYKRGYLIDAISALDANEVMGINSRLELARANRIMQRRLNEEFMKNGVTIIDPESAFINYGTRIGADTVIYPFTVIERDVKIGKRCFIGPFIHLREGTQIEDDITAGNFIEAVRTKVGSKTFIKHFSYLGDTRIGRGVNIGAGTVTANFNGQEKNLTVIEDKAFIGSDTVLVAPVKVGRNAKTGAGTIVPRGKNIPAGKLAVGVPARILKG